MSVRFVLADHQFLVREGTAALLAGTPGLELVGTAEDLDGLLAAVEETVPDVVLTDIRMPPGFSREGIEAARRIRSRHPTIGVLVLSQYVEEDYAFALLGEGTTGVGYLLKERIGDRAELVHALQTVASGGSLLDPKIVEAVVKEKWPGRSPLGTLTQRERAVLEQLTLGKRNAVIGDVLGVSERAVEEQVSALFANLGLTEEADVHRRVAAVLTVLRQP